jgi:hypothetical protein
MFAGNARVYLLPILTQHLMEVSYSRCLELNRYKKNDYETCSETSSGTVQRYSRHANHGRAPTGKQPRNTWCE